ncbi:MAG: nucleotidyltransferase family protein [Bacteroidia bacterium]
MKPLFSRHDREKMTDEIRNYFMQQPVRRAWLFGSFARNEAREESDIDILVQFEESNNIDLFDFVGIKLDLEDLTGRQIDLVELGFEYDSIKSHIEEDKILIYERQAEHN